jgi:hypothetical protein
MPAKLNYYERVFPENPAVSGGAPTRHEPQLEKAITDIRKVRDM